MKSGVSRTVLALLVAGTYFMENLDATIIMPAIPAMAASFGVAPVDLNVGVSAYLLTLGVFIPVSGWAAQRFGPRRIFALAIAVFTVASLLCGLATGLWSFVLARVMQGMGGAMMVPVGRLLVLRETPKEGLVKAIAILTWPALIAPVLGPPLGGLIAGHGDWRWNFLLNLPLGAIALGLALRWVPRLPPEGGRRFDWPGFLMCGGGLLCLMLAGEWLSRQGASMPSVMSLLALGVILLALAWRHLGRTSAPVFELAALRIPTFATALVGGSLFRMSIGAIPFLVPLMLQLGFGYRPESAGMVLMAVFAGNLLMKPMTTPVMRRWGFRPVLLGNGLLNGLLIAACALFTAATPLWLICAVLFFGGMARSMQFTALNSIAFADVEKPAMTAANTLFSTVFQLAMGLGVALGGMGWRLGSALTSGSHSVAAFHIAFLVVAGVSLLGVVDSLWLRPGAGEQVIKGRRQPAATRAVRGSRG